MKKKPSAIVDPTLPFTEIEIGGKTYKMCFTFGALALGEAALIRQGHDVNLLQLMPRPNFSNLGILFAASIYHFHPEVEFAAAVGMVTLTNAYEIVAAINAAWVQSMPEPDQEASENPPPPAP